MRNAIAYVAGTSLSLTKIRKVFTPRTFHWDHADFDFNDWERWMLTDGMLCRNDNDCNWLDPQLGCNDYNFRRTRVRGAWPWKAQLKGTCYCSFGFDFDASDGVCRRS